MRRLWMIWSVTLACHAPVAQTPTPPPGEIVTVDFHVHSSLGSNDTDGLGTPTALREAMAKARLDFVFLTDHSNCLGSMDCHDVEDCPNQGPERTEGVWDAASVWLASEISPVASLDKHDTSPRGHVGCLPLDQAEGFVTKAFIDRPPGVVSGGSAIDQCHEAAGWAIINHPFGPARWVSFDQTSDAFDAVEVYNGGARFDASDAESLTWWRELRQTREHLVAVGGSDSHRWGVAAPGDLLNPALGWPVNDVMVREGESVLDAVMAGRVVVREPTTQLSLLAVGQHKAGGPGDHIDFPAQVTAVASSTVEGMELQIMDLHGEILASTPLSGETTVHLTVDHPTAIMAVVWPIDTPAGLLQGGVALTNPVTFVAP